MHACACIDATHAVADPPQNVKARALTFLQRTCTAPASDGISALKPRVDCGLCFLRAHEKETLSAEEAGLVESVCVEFALKFSNQ
jgi:hypothetical protein